MYSSRTPLPGKQILRKGLSPLATTISTDTAAPVIAGMRLRAGKAASSKGAGRMVAQAIATVRPAGATDGPRLTLFPGKEEWNLARRHAGMTSNGHARTPPLPL